MRLKVRESSIQKTILEGLKAKKIPAWRLNSGATIIDKRFLRYGFAGCPDIIALLDGGVLFIEVKSETGSLSTAQEQFRDLCFERGIKWLLARSWDDVSGYISDALRSQKAPRR